jgi:type IV secretory pathway VirD2 relaxase
VTYLSNRARGQWRAHGRYLARESAAESKAAAAGFNRERDDIDVVCELEKWQSSGDQRLWKIIVSPEFGDRIDLHRLARDLIGQMERDLETELEWVAVTHHNTEHPHVHMAIRGVTNARQPLCLKREYVKHGIRGIAEEMCTRQLGYRTSRDAAEAERHEVGECRFTSLDRALLRHADQATRQSEPPHFTVVKKPAQVGRDESARRHLNHLFARLAVLQRMGLAESVGENTWLVRQDFEEVLRAMQRAKDRQRILAVHGVPISDKRLPIEMLDTRHFTAVEGRILAHGEDEQSGRRYLMLEGTDAKVHLIYQTPEIEEARSRGGLRTNSFVRLRKLFVAGQPILDVHEFGDAEQFLKNRSVLRENARALLKRGLVPTQDGWGGWLGRYQAALADVAGEIMQNRRLGTVRAPEQRRDRSRGR